ncbi:hypothetical protein [Nonomuraea soli]|uniref:Uncharacterized protein n=1 Tax=Nonomuraea soli TaxID=1032476 RepID=A0A7W0CK71_9ACTN|nr:hypothetical protein [Nonomuraea soli]MBA2892460.1 hypothetical protein [Nonomuraea soli]
MRKSYTGVIVTAVLLGGLVLLALLALLVALVLRTAPQTGKRAATSSPSPQQRAEQLEQASALLTSGQVVKLSYRPASEKADVTGQVVYVRDDLAVGEYVRGKGRARVVVAYGKQFVNGDVTWWWDQYDDDQEYAWLLAGHWYENGDGLGHDLHIGLTPSSIANTLDLAASRGTGYTADGKGIAWSLGEGDYRQEFWLSDDPKEFTLKVRTDVNQGRVYDLTYTVVPRFERQPVYDELVDAVDGLRTAASMWSSQAFTTFKWGSCDGSACTMKVTMTVGEGSGRGAAVGRMMLYTKKKKLGSCETVRRFTYSSKEQKLTVSCAVRGDTWRVFWTAGAKQDYWGQTYAAEVALKEAQVDVLLLQIAELRD